MTEVAGPAPMAIPVHFLADTAPLHTADASAAVIVVDGGTYLMQQRDDIPGIFYPGHWGCFGGKIDPGETPLAALRRELAEEIELDPADCREFIRLDFDLSRLTGRTISRTYYEVRVDVATAARLVLHEGRTMQALRPTELFDGRPLSPFDSFALWLHVARHRLR
jgi:8-oxo-dGTP pyrophosphatase MutT (NUDIX family)